MKSQTRGATIAAPPSEVFAYVSQPENLPTWAPDFASCVRAHGDHWIATSEAGELEFTLGLNEDAGVVDFHMRVAGDAYALLAPTRVVPNGRDATEYLFTLFARPGEDDEAFDKRVSALDGEFAMLRALLEEPVEV